MESSTIHDHKFCNLLKVIGSSHVLQPRCQPDKAYLFKLALNSQLSSCYFKARGPILLCYLTHWWGEDGFMPVRMAFVQSDENKTGIWTQYANSTFCIYKHYKDSFKIFTKLGLTRGHKCGALGRINLSTEGQLD